MWERLGVLEGGTVAALTVLDEPGGQAALLAVTPAGLFGTRPTATSEGLSVSWAPLSAEGGPPLGTAVAVSPSGADDGTLFVASRAGLYRSTDGGRRWQLVLAGEVLAVALSPDFAADGTLFVGSAQDGALRSDDRGDSWEGANAGLLDLAVLAVALSPAFARDRTAFVGTASGLYRSRNGGRSWREVSLGVGEAAVQVLALSPRFPEDRLVLAGTEAHGLFRSTDGGGRFEPVAALTERGISALTIAPDGGTVVVAAGQEVWRSDDAGASWRPIPPAPGLVVSLALVPTPLGARLAAGLYRLGVAWTDGSTNWRPENAGLAARLLTRLVPSPRFAEDRTLFGISLDEGVLVSRDGGRVWECAWPEEADPAVAALAVSTRFPEDRTVLASTAERLFLSEDAGASWRVLPPDAAPPLRVLAPLLPGRAGAGVVGVALETAADPWQPGQIVLSEDGGRSWRGAGRLAADTPGWRVEVGALAPSPAFEQDRTLFASGVETRADGSATFRVWRSTDAGRSWQVWLEEPAAPEPPLPTTLLVPPTYPRDGRIVVAVGGRILAPLPGAWERRGGRRRPAWRAADLGATAATVTALAASLDEPDGQIVYAATSAGPLVSRDGGRSFAPWAEGYAGGGLVALAVSPTFREDRLVLAIGVGGTLWQRRDEG